MASAGEHFPDHYFIRALKGHVSPGEVAIPREPRLRRFVTTGLEAVSPSVLGILLYQCPGVSSKSAPL